MKTKVSVVFYGGNYNKPDVGEYYEFNGELYQLTDKVIIGTTGIVESLHMRKVDRTISKIYKINRPVK